MVIDLTPWLNFLLRFFPPLIRDIIVAAAAQELQVPQMTVGQKIESDPPAFRYQWNKGFKYRVSVERFQ